MKLFEKFRIRVALKRIARTEARRKGTVTLARPVSAANIALLAAPADESSYRYLTERIERWQAKGKSVQAIFWHDTRQLPAWTSPDVPGLVNLCRKETGFFFVPESSRLDPFVREPFNILINIAPPDCLPLLYIVANSAATFRAGFSDGNLFFHDFTLLPGKTPEESLNLETLIHHLNQLNS